MKYLAKYCTLLMAMLFMAVVPACSDDDEPAPNPPTTPTSLTLSSEVVEMVSTGGRGYVIYTLENAAVEEATVEVSSNADWVNGFDTTVEGRIAFNVDPNTTKEERLAEVTVTYGTGEEAPTAKFTVKQAAASEFFAFGDAVATESTLDIKITPTSKDMSYLVMIMPKTQADTYTTDDEIFEDDMLYIQNLADKLGTSFETLLSRYMLTGENTVGWESLVPDTPYCIYVYGVNAKGTRITPIAKTIASTSEIKEVEVDFDISYNINGSVVEMSVVPSNDDVYYYFNILDAGTPDEQIVSIVQNNLDQIYNLYMQYGYSLEQAVQATVFKGPQTSVFSRALKPDTDYLGFAMTVSQSGKVSAKITRKDLHTGKVEQSDLKLDIKVSDIRPRSAQLVCVPSNQEEQYVIHYALYSDYGHLSDQQVLDALSQFVRQGAIQSGNGTLNQSIGGLTPETKYVVLACGMNGSAPTTQLYRKEFETTEDGFADVTLDVKHDKYFSAADAAQRWPNEIFSAYTQYAILPVTVKTSGDKVHYKLYSEDLTNPLEYDDNTLISVLSTEGYTDESMFFFVPFGNKSTLLAVAEDANGYFGEVYRELITLDREGISPIDEFDYTPSYVRGKKARALLPGKVKATSANARCKILPKAAAKAVISSPLQRIDEMQPWKIVKDIMSRRLPVKK